MSYVRKISSVGLSHAQSHSHWPVPVLPSLLRVLQSAPIILLLPQMQKFYVQLRSSQTVPLTLRYNMPVTISLRCATWIPVPSISKPGSLQVSSSHNCTDIVVSHWIPKYKSNLVKIRLSLRLSRALLPASSYLFPASYCIILRARCFVLFCSLYSSSYKAILETYKML